MSASRQQADILNSLLSAMLFPVCNRKFPVPIAGNSPKEVSCFNGFVQAGRGVSPKFPVFSPGIREFEKAEPRSPQPLSTATESRVCAVIPQTRCRVHPPSTLQLCCKDTAVLKLHLPRAGFLQLQTRCGFRSIATMNKKAPLPDLRSRKPTWDKATALADEWETRS